MTTHKEALKLALEALEVAEHFVEEYAASKYYYAHVAATTAIKEALAQPEEQHSCDKQEPVAWFWKQIYTDGYEWKHMADNQADADKFLPHQVIPLYTTPPQRKPLTDEEIGAILEGVNAYGTRLYTFARAIEAAHGIKEKNT